MQDQTPSAQHSSSGAQLPAPDARAALAAASAGLVLLSEIDAPFEALPSVLTTGSDQSAVRAMLSVDASVPIEERPLAEFLRGQIEDVDPGDPVGVADIPRYRALRAAFERQLIGARMYYVGDGPERIVVVAGRAQDSMLVGLRSRVLET